MEVGQKQQLIVSFDSDPAATSKAINNGGDATSDVVDLTWFTHPLLFVTQTAGALHDETPTNVDFYPCLPDGTMTATASLGTATITPAVGAATNHCIPLPLGLSNFGTQDLSVSMPAMKIKFTNGDGDKDLTITSAIVLASHLT